MDITTRESLYADMEARFKAGEKLHLQTDECARVVPTLFGGPKAIQTMGKDKAFKMMDATKPISSTTPIIVTGKYRNGFEVPFVATGENTQSVRDMIVAGKFAANSLPDVWQNFWDAQRIDLTIKKTLHQTVRQFFYEIMSTPNATPIMELREMFPYAFEFKENNGEGQAVPLGQKRLGQKDLMSFFLKATGFTFTLMADLYDATFDMAKVNDGVAMAYALTRDNDAMSPILAYDYSINVNGDAQSGPHVDAAMKRQELLYCTLEDAIDDLSERTDPLITDKKIDANGLVLLCNSYDARHIARVLNGLPSVNERSYPGISEVSRIVAYDTNYIDFEDHTNTFTGVTKGKCYLVKPNRYMKIAVKRDLTMEVDEKPDVLTLARAQRAWYYAEAIYNEIGIANFIQEVTLPAW